MTAKKPNSESDDANRAKALPSQRLWKRYVVRYNVHASKRGLARIRTLADLAQSRAGNDVFLPDDEVLRMQLGYYADWIDDMEPLAKAGFGWLTSQRKRSQLSRRNAFRDLYHLLVGAPRYRDYTNRQLWGELIAIAETHGVKVCEEEPDVIEWDILEGPSAGDCGDLTFRSFETALSRIRKAAGTLKRPRKKG